MADEYNPDDRRGPCPEESAHVVSSLVVDFAIPVHITSEQIRALMLLLGSVVKKPWNLPKNGVHWVSGLGRPQEDTIQIVSSARGFVTDEERDRELLKQKSPGLCEACREPQYMTPSGPTCKNGHGGAGSLDPETGELLPTVSWGEPPRARRRFDLDDF